MNRVTCNRARLSVLLSAVSTVVLAGPVMAEELRIGVPSEVTSMDPHFHNLTPNNQVARQIFSGLILQGTRQELMPGLAESWKPIDPLTWEFKLRRDVKFHDGSDFNADDVLCTFERVPNVPNSPASFGIYSKGKTLVKIDDYTLHIKTEEPYPLMANDISTIDIVSDTAGCNASTDDFNQGKATIGTGPYKFVEYVPGDRIVLKRNDDYFGDKADFEDVVIKPIKSAPARVAAILAGDVDMIASVPTTDLERLKKDDSLRITEGVSNRVIYLHFDQFREDSPFVKGNDGKPIKNPFLDVRVRQAVSKAIHREAIVERVMEGQAIPAGQLLPDGFFGTSDKLKPDAYDPKGAKQLLADAGYPEGFQMTIHGPNDRYVNDARILEAVAQMLNRIGIKAEVETLSRSVFFKRASRERWTAGIFVDSGGLGCRFGRGVFAAALADPYL